MNPGDTTDVLTAVPGQMPAPPPAACPLPRHPARRLAAAWLWANAYATLGVWTWFLVLVARALWGWG